MPHRTILTRETALVKKDRVKRRLSLPRLVALLRLVDDVDAALATHEAVVAMAVAQGFQRITDFHDITKGSTRGVEPTADKLKRRSYASNGRRDQGGRAISTSAGARPSFGRTPATDCQAGVGAKNPNLRVETLHEGCRRPEIESPVSGDVHS